MLDFSPEVLWEYGKLVFLSLLIGTAIGFAYTYFARKLTRKRDVRNDFRQYLPRAMLMCLILWALTMSAYLGKPTLVFIFAAFTEFVRFFAIPWAAAMVVSWKYIPPWELFSVSYYKKRRHDDEQ